MPVELLTDAGQCAPACYPQRVGAMATQRAAPPVRKFSRHQFWLIRLALIGLFAWDPALGLAQSSRPGMGSIPYADAAGTGVTFRVWAPHAASVNVPGTFNGWSTTANPLVQEGLSGLWSADIPAARAGHEYKYFINGSYWWKDPRSRKVTYSGYDSPGANSIIYDPGAFDWMGDARLAVNAPNLVIYEMHVGTFHDPTPASGGPGKFMDAIAKLDHLSALGVNAVELLPIAEFPGDNSWGYNPADLYAVENSGYGGPDGLKSFVRAAHGRGIRVLLDVVHNHWGPTDFELFGFDTGSANRFYVYTNSGICCTAWGNRPNYANEGVRSFIIDNIRMWQDEYHVDGFRWDAVGAMRHYDPGYVSIPEADTLIQYINSAVIDSNSISIAEDDSSGMDFDAQWNTGFGDTLIAQVTKTSDADRDMNVLSAVMSGAGFARVLYSESHDLVGDLNGPANQRLPKRIDPATPDSYWARKRSMLAAATVLTTPGIPMLFMGQELLEVNQFGTGNPLQWSRTNTYAGVLEFYRDLIQLRRNLDGVSLGLTGPNLTWHVVRDDTTYKLLAFHRWGAGPNDQVMVVLNFANTVIPSYWISGWPADGVWYANLNSDSTRYGSDFGNLGSARVTVSGGSGEIAIGPYSVLILSRQDLAAAVNSQLEFTSVHNENGNLVLNWTGPTRLWQIIQRAASLAGPWNDIYTNAPPTPITNVFVVPGPIASPAYFRVNARP
ncbi:MAG: alpha amylase C-terminal domain-containing protein [Verrucomicrobia bacterium]|nr:alpha amylase C-terminal domain-containing protein [Verrucomicrobiota bacterium]